MSFEEFSFWIFRIPTISLTVILNGKYKKSSIRALKLLSLSLFSSLFAIYTDIVYILRKDILLEIHLQGSPVKIRRPKTVKV